MSGRNQVETETNAAGFPVAYQCGDIVRNNQVQSVGVTFFYDLSFDSTATTAESARQQLEANLLDQVSITFGFDTGLVCQSPTEQGIWLVRVSSLPDDTPNLMFDECFDLTPNATESCISFEGHMSGFAIGPEDPAALVDTIATKFADGTLTTDTTLRTSFLGTTIDQDSITGGRDNLPPAVNTPDQPVQIDEGGRRFTPIGVLLILGLALAVVGVLFVLLRLRRRRSEQLRQDAIMATRSHEQDFGVEDELKLDPTDLSNFDRGFPDGGLSDDTGVGPLASPPSDFENKYTFDVGNLMKNELFGVHGHRQDGSKKDLDESDLSESDVDSWAQTDATLGSIEHRLEPITAEV